MSEFMEISISNKSSPVLNSNESVYSLKELAAKAYLFDTTKDCVMAALKFSGKTCATLDDARNIIKNFVSRSV